MSVKEFSEFKKAQIELRHQASYWKFQHAATSKREKALKAKVLQLKKVNKLQAVQIEKLNFQVEKLESEVAWLKQQLFGRKSEQSKDTTCLETSDVIKRKRGQQKGAASSGRKMRKNLPAEIVFHDLPENQKKCPKCGKPYRLFNTTLNSEEIHIEVCLSRRIHKRKQYATGCNCAGSPVIITTPPPPKLIPKGMFSIDFWVHILLEKYLFQRPLSRILKTFELEGLHISSGTITDGLKKIKEMIYPLYPQILERNRTAKHWHMDETRWMMFVNVDGKKGYCWWLWVSVTDDTCAYIIDPSRSAKVPGNHLGENPKGIISADRYAAYKALGEDVKIAFCWGHVRRDYIKIRDNQKKLYSWAESWLARINEIFHLNKSRMSAISNPEKFNKADKTLRTALTSMKEAYTNELDDENLNPVKQKALKSLHNHWQGLNIFVNNPSIPMDNNLSERKLREPALGRKNYYGSSSEWSGDLTAALFTIFQTAIINKINPKKIIRAYLEACAENQGKAPENIDNFLPWNLSDELKSAWSYPEAPT